MTYSVFLSHSTKDHEFIDKLADALVRFRVQVYVAERDWKFGSTLAEKIESAIRDCDGLLAIVTSGGGDQAYVNQETGLALNGRKPIIAIVEKGCNLNGFRPGIDWLQFERSNPAKPLVALAYDTRPENMVGTIALAGLALWLEN